MNKFCARYEVNGIRRSFHFDKSVFTQETATEWLNAKGIKNFFFFFEPTAPKMIDETRVLLSGEVGFDITLPVVTDLLNQNLEIILDTFGGDSWEALKIYDHIKALGKNPSIGILGSCMSAGMQILLATENRWMTENSRGLIHNPWAYEVGDDQTMANAAKSLEREKLQIANIYSKVSERPIDDILELMKKEQILSSDQMLELNFVTAVKGENFNIIKKRENKMNNEAIQKIGVIEGMLNSIHRKLFPPKNIVLQDVNGVEIDFGNAIETPEQIQIGTTATVNGAPAQGAYIMADGTTYVFENGAVTEITKPEEVDPMTEENATLKEEVANLKNQLQNSVNEANALKTEYQNLKDEFVKIQSAFNSFKAEYSKDKADQNKPTEETKTKKFTFKKR